MLTIVNTVLIGLVCFAALAVMVQLHFGGHGVWRRHPSGQSVMALLAVIVIITGLATASTLIGPFTARPWLYGAVYVALFWAVLRIGAAITYTRRSSDDGEMDR